MIKEIEAKEYERFLRANNSIRQQVSINTKGVHYGYYHEDRLVGVISTNSTKNTIRVKGFLVNQGYSGKGIGTKLLAHIIDETTTMTAFSTVHSRPLFEQFDFKLVDEKPNNIVFLKRLPTNKMPPLSADIEKKLDEIIGELAMVIVPLERDQRKQAIEHAINTVRRIR